MTVRTAAPHTGRTGDDALAAENERVVALPAADEQTAPPAADRVAEPADDETSGSAVGDRRPGGRAHDGGRAVSRSRRSPVAVVLVLVVLLVLGAGVLLWFERQRAVESEAAAREATAVAPAAAAALFSYDYRTFDASAASGRSFAAGAFAQEYARTTASLKEAAVREQAVVTAQVTAVSVVTATPDRVELLLFVNQYRRNANITGEKVDQNRITLTLTRTPGTPAWKVTAVTAL